MSPDRPSLEQARKRAKDLLRRARAGEPQALARLVRRDRPPQLADAQLVIARDLGFATWPALVAALAAPSATGEDGGRALPTLAQILELLRGSRQRWRTLRAEGTEWRDDEVGLRAFLRSTPPGSVVGVRGEPEPEPHQHRWRVWISQPDRARAESDGPHGAVTTIYSGDRSWTSMPWHAEGSRVGDQPADVVTTLSPASLLLDTAPMSAGFRLEVVGGRTVAQRAAVIVTGQPVESRAPGAPSGPLRGADEVEFAVDAALGVILSITATIGDEPFYQLAMSSLFLDGALDEELFTIPDGLRPSAASASGRSQATNAPPRRDGPPDGVLGEAVSFRPLIARSDSVVVAVDRIVAYPSGFELGVTVRQRPGQFAGLTGPRMAGGSGSTPGQSSADALQVSVVFADGAQGSTAGRRRARPGDAPQPDRLPVSVLTGHGTGQRLDQRLWVSRLPPPGELSIVVSLPELGIQDTRRTLQSELILDAAGRCEWLWPDDST